MAGVLKSQLHTEMFKVVTVIQNPSPTISTLVPPQAYVGICCIYCFSPGMASWATLCLIQAKKIHGISLAEGKPEQADGCFDLCLFKVHTWDYWLNYFSHIFLYWHVESRPKQKRPPGMHITNIICYWESIKKSYERKSNTSYRRLEVFQTPIHLRKLWLLQQV